MMKIHALFFKFLSASDIFVNNRVGKLQSFASLFVIILSLFSQSYLDLL